MAVEEGSRQQAVGACIVILGDVDMSLEWKIRMSSARVALCRVECPALFML